MRLSIVLTICFLGVASASTLVKRNLFDDLNEKLQETLNNVLDRNESERVPFSNPGQILKDLDNPVALGQDFLHLLDDYLHRDRSKRATNPLTLINDLKDPAQFAQDLVKMLAEMALQGGRRKRATNPLTLINDLKDPGQFAQDLVKMLAEMALQGGRRKRATNPLTLINDLKDPGQFAQDLVKILADMALQGGRRKRDLFNQFGHLFNDKIQEAINVFLGNKNATNSLPNPSQILGDLNNPTALAQDLMKIIGDYFQSRNNAQSVNPLTLLGDLNDPIKFAQDLVKILADMALQGRRKRDLAEDLRKFADAGKQRAADALKKIMDLFSSFKNGGASDETSTEQTVSKRDVSEDLQKIADAGKEKVQEALKQLQDLFEQFKGGFNHDQSSETVTKRDVTESLKHFSQVAQEKTQSAFQHLKDAFAGLFGLKPSDEVEDSTEVSVSKRSVFDDLGKFNENLQNQAQQALSGFRSAFSDFLNQFKPAKPVVEEVEDTTESA